MKDLPGRETMKRVSSTPIGSSLPEKKMRRHLDMAEIVEHITARRYTDDEIMGKILAPQFTSPGKNMEQIVVSANTTHEPRRRSPERPVRSSSVATASHTSSTTLTSPPTTRSPVTAWEAVCRHYPDVKSQWPNVNRRARIRRVAEAPARRDIIPNRHHNARRKPASFKIYFNVDAVLVQVAGVLKDSNSQCDSCSKSCGHWKGCVVAPGESADALRGACANCFYNGRGSRCSFTLTNQRDGTEEELYHETEEELSTPSVSNLDSQGASIGASAVMFDAASDRRQPDVFSIPLTARLEEFQSHCSWLCANLQSLSEDLAMDQQQVTIPSRRGSVSYTELDGRFQASLRLSQASLAIKRLRDEATQVVRARSRS